MPLISVSPAKVNFENTGGLCGMWDNDKSENKELYVLDKNGYDSYLPNLNNITLAESFWKYKILFQLILTIIVIIKL